MIVRALRAAVRAGARIGARLCPCRRGALGVGAMLAMAACPQAAAAAGCTVARPNTLAADLGSFSPVAVNKGVVPVAQSFAGLTCPTNVIVLLGSNWITATLTSQNNLKLKRTGSSDLIGYVASASSDGTARFTQGGSVNYMQNNLLNVLGLLGGSSAALPIFIKPSGGAVPPLGTYTDRITIDWDWYICPVAVCVTGADQGSGSVTVTVSLTVTARDMVLSLASATTWDPTNKTDKPRALPGSKGRVTLTAANPDLVPLGAVAMVYAVPPNTVIALDGDGASTGAAIRLTEGTPASTLSLSYAGAGADNDDVDFSTDSGATWTYAPVAGDMASQRAITTMRFRPQGTMAPQSSFSVSVPYLVQ